MASAAAKMKRRGVTVRLPFCINTLFWHYHAQTLHVQPATFKLYEANEKMNLNLVKDGKESKPKRLLVTASGTGFDQGWAEHLSSGLNSSCSVTDPCVNTTRSASNCCWLQPDVAADCAAFVGLALSTPPSKQAPSLLEANVTFQTSGIAPRAYNFALHVPLNNGIHSIRPNIPVALEVRGRVCANKSAISILPSVASAYSHTEHVEVVISDPHDMDGLPIRAEFRDPGEVVKLKLCSPSMCDDLTMTFNVSSNNHLVNVPQRTHAGTYTLKALESTDQQCAWHTAFRSECTQGYRPDRTGNCVIDDVTCGTAKVMQYSGVGSNLSHLIVEVDGTEDEPAMTLVPVDATEELNVTKQTSTKWRVDQAIPTGKWTLQHKSGAKVCPAKELKHVKCDVSGYEEGLASVFAVQRAVERWKSIRVQVQGCLIQSSV
jgi:hypothetical protein